MNWVEAVIAIKLLNIEITRIAVTSMDLDRQVIRCEPIFGRPRLGDWREQFEQRGTFPLPLIYAGSFVVSNDWHGLETWLTANGYRMPTGAGPVLGSYIKQNMRFFVAKVNVKEQSRLGYAFLRPLQVAYESPKFMLPIRLGTVNSSGTQELFIFALTRSGRVETTNYRTVKLPSGMELPASTKERFAPFYRAMFDHMVRLEDMRAVFLEYAWDMGWCDPCAADPLSDDELRTLGVFWLDPGSARFSRPPNVGPAYARPAGPRDVFVTRLHLRYDGAHFPEDLVFQQTGNRENFQGRYVLRHDWSGGDTCPAAEQYRRSLPDRHERQAQTLASLTGWKIEDIRKQAGLPAAAEEVAWWRRIWK